MAELRSYTPTLRERIAAALMGENASQPRRAFVSGVMGSTGLGSTGMGLADITPLGIPMAVQEEYRRGNPQGMALAATPFGVGAKAGRGVISSVIPREVVETLATPAGPIKRMTDVPNIRGVPVEEGIAIARGEPHHLAGGVMGGSYALAPPVAGGAGMGIKAYHGSPHDFDRFDLSKIGTGEGAQAYGHGLYFAENPKVASDYKRRLSGSENIHADEAGFQKYKNEWDVALSNLQKFKADNPGWERSAELRPVAISLSDALSPISEKMLADTLQRKPWLKEGRMYEVNINAKPEQFLDWDRPLAGQIAAEKAPQLLEAAKKEAYSRALGATQQSRADQLWNMVKNPELAPGEFAYRAMSDRFGSGVKPEVMAGLRDAGIPGIKYLDQGSRGVGGTSNYVVNDDKLIDILRKYGLMGLGAIPALAPDNQQ